MQRLDEFRENKSPIQSQRWYLHFYFAGAACLALLFLLLILVHSNAKSHRPYARPESREMRTIVGYRKVPPHQGERFFIKRTKLLCPQGSVILLHYPSIATKLVTEYVNEDGLPIDDTRIPLTDESNRWVMAARSSPSSFNCCAYAVGDLIGLEPTDWVGGNYNESTDFLNPMKTVLESYFDRTATHVDPWSYAREFARDDSVRPNDVICFIGVERPLEVIHAGKVIDRGGRNRVLSKYGEEPVVLDCSISSIMDDFPGIKQIWTFRIRPH